MLGVILDPKIQGGHNRNAPCLCGVHNPAEVRNIEYTIHTGVSAVKNNLNRLLRKRIMKGLKKSWKASLRRLHLSWNMKLDYKARQNIGVGSSRRELRVLRHDGRSEEGVVHECDLFFLDSWDHSNLMNNIFILKSKVSKFIINRNLLYMLSPLTYSEFQYLLNYIFGFLPLASSSFLQKFVYLFSWQ